MSDSVPTTDGNQPVETGGEQPAATQPKSDPPATDDNVVTLKQEDYNNLIAQRDRANNINSDTDEIVNDLLKEREIKKFLESNQDQFPDVTYDDLMIAATPDELEEVAKTRQKRYEDVVQKKLMDVQKTTAPVLSPQERAAQLKKLRDNPDDSSFEKMLDLQLAGE